MVVLTGSHQTSNRIVLDNIFVSQKPSGQPKKLYSSRGRYLDYYVNPHRVGGFERDYSHPQTKEEPVLPY